MEAVFTAIRSVYLPWIEESASYLQKLFDQSPYPCGSHSDQKLAAKNSGECILFIDGLRFDTAKRLLTLFRKKRFYHNGKICLVSPANV